MMREYLEWQQDRGPVRVRIHRRVLAGLEREGVAGMSGVVLGTVAESAREVRVEDYVPLEPDDEVDPSLPAVGYFQTGDRNGSDWGLAARHFPGPHVALRFDVGAEGVRLANVLVEPGGQQRSPAAPGTSKHRVHYRAGVETVAGPVARPVAAPSPGEAEEGPAGWRRLLWPAIAIVAGFLIGGVAYLSVRGDAPKAVPAESTQTQPKDPMPAAPRETVPAATAPPSNEADRMGEAPPTRAEVQNGVRASIERWRTTLLKDDVNGHTSVYAASVGPYFTKSQATREEIAGEVRQMIGRYGPIRKYKITELTVAPADANHAIANFRKEWATSGNRFTGSDREQLRFVREGSEWRIASEQELKVYWVHRK